MKKNELREMLKPLIKECIKEVIFEDGILSKVVSEVTLGLGAQVIQETNNTAVSPSQPDFSRTNNVELQEESQRDLEKRKRKLEESLGGGAYSGIFENITPIAKAGAPSDANGSAASPLSSYAPNDPGIDINGLMNAVGGHNWKKMI